MKMSIVQSKQYRLEKIYHRTTQTKEAIKQKEQK